MITSLPLSYTHTPGTSLEGRDCRHTVSYPHPCECVYVVWLSTMQSTRTLLHTNQFETGWLLVAALNIRTYSIPVNVCLRKSWGEMCVDHLNSMCDCRIQNAEGAKFPVSRRLLFIYNCGIGQMTNIRVYRMGALMGEKWVLGGWRKGERYSAEQRCPVSGKIDG